MGLLNMVRERQLRPEVPEAISPAEEVADLVNVLAEECIAVYPLAKVEKYMDTNGRWSWFPMKSQQQRLTVSRETPTQYRSLYGDTETSLYAQPIPLPVLLTAERIVDRLGDRVSFFVAALNDKPDPFLGVVLNTDPSRKIFVIERWDEPGFRG